MFLDPTVDESGANCHTFCFSKHISGWVYFQNTISRQTLKSTKRLFTFKETAYSKQRHMKQGVFLLCRRRPLPLLPVKHMRGNAALFILDIFVC